MNIGRTTDVILIELIEEPRPVPLQKEREDVTPVTAMQLVEAEAA